MNEFQVRPIANLLLKQCEKASMNGTDFGKFEATLDGVPLGASILHKDWNSDGVLQQLTVDGCPLGKGDVEVVGWPGDHFEVIRQDKQRLQFHRVA